MEKDFFQTTKQIVPLEDAAAAAAVHLVCFRKKKGFHYGFICTHEHTHAHTSCLLAAYHFSLSHGREDIGDIQHFQEAVSFPAVKAGFFCGSKQELQ